MSPFAWRQVRNDLALIYHWQPSELDEMEWLDLVADHAEAVKRFNVVHGSREGAA